MTLDGLYSVLGRDELGLQLQRRLVPHQRLLKLLLRGERTVREGPTTGLNARWDCFSSALVTTLQHFLSGPKPLRETGVREETTTSAPTHNVTGPQNQRERGGWHVVSAYYVPNTQS